MKRKSIIFLAAHFLLAGIFLWLDLSKYFLYYNLADIINYQNVNSIVGILITIITILFAIYVLVIEVLKQNFKKDAINKFVNKSLSFNIVSLPITSFLGLLLIIVNYQFYYCSLYVYLLFLINIIVLSLKFINNLYSNKKSLFWTDSLINSIGKSLEIKLNPKTKNDKINITSEFLEYELTKIFKHYDDALNNNHHHITKHVLYITEKIYKDIISNKVRLTLDNNDTRALKIIEVMAKYLANMMWLTLNCNSSMLKIGLFSTLYQIQMYNFKCGEQECFQIISQEINSKVKLIEDDKQFKHITSIYSSIIIELIENDEYSENLEKRNNWINYTIGELQSLTRISYIYSSIQLLKRIVEFYFLTILLLTKKNEEYYKFNYLCDCLKLSLFRLGTMDREDNNYISTILTPLTKEIIKTKNDKIIENFIDFISELSKDVLDYDKTNTLYSLSFSLDDISKQTNNSTITTKIYQVQKTLTNSCIASNSRMLLATLPDYKKEFENCSDSKFENYLVNDFYNYIGRSINSKNLVSLMLFTDYISTYSETLKMKDKLRQQKIIKLFKYAINKSISNNDRETFNLCISELYNIIEKFNNKNSISKKLYSYIINQLYYLCRLDLNTNKTYYVVQIIGRLRTISKLSISYNDEENLDLIIDKLFNIGISSIEYNNHDIIKTVSNWLGWIGFDALKRGQKHVFCSVLNSSKNLINIYTKINSQDIEKDLTAAFLGTLLIVLGAMAKNKLNVEFENEVIRYSKMLFNLQFLENSKHLREYTFADDDDDDLNDFINQSNNYKSVNYIYKRIIDESSTKGDKPS